MELGSQLPRSVDSIFADCASSSLREVSKSRSLVT